MNGIILQTLWAAGVASTPDPQGWPSMLPPILEALAALFWPILLIVIFFFFRPALAAIIESAKSRKLTIKIGGQELTLGEANEQYRALIDDLRTQVVELNKRMDTLSPAPSPSAEAALDGTGEPGEQAGEFPSIEPRCQSPAPCRNGAILWVDDHPKNNSLFIQTLNELGVRVEIARKTQEGMEKFLRGSFDYIISDMGRTEGGSYNADAGLDLLREIRKHDPEIPFYIYCGTRGVERLGETATKAGVTGITSSPTELYRMLRIDELKRLAP